jgi:hypothetical protein
MSGRYTAENGHYCSDELNDGNGSRAAGRRQAVTWQKPSIKCD